MKNWFANLTPQKVLFLTLLLAFAYVVIKVIFSWLVVLVFVGALYFLYVALTRPSTKQLDKQDGKDKDSM